MLPCGAWIETLKLAVCLMVLFAIAAMVVKLIELTCGRLFYQRRPSIQEPRGILRVEPFFDDEKGLFDVKNAAGVDTTALTTLRSVVASGSRSQWLFLVRPQGPVEVSAFLIHLATSFLTSMLRSGPCLN